MDTLFACRLICYLEDVKLKKVPSMCLQFPGDALARARALPRCFQLKLWIFEFFRSPRGEMRESKGEGKG
jgi:hypothetical protein